MTLSTVQVTEDFNPRSREGSDMRSKRCAMPGCYFNPRSREGSDQAFMPFGIGHVPISIHAPVRGATRRHSRPTGAAGYFNPRSREGSDMTVGA